MTAPWRFVNDVLFGLLVVLAPIDDALFGWTYAYRFRRWGPT